MDYIPSLLRPYNAAWTCAINDSFGAPPKKENQMGLKEMSMNK